MMILNINLWMLKSSFPIIILLMVIPAILCFKRAEKTNQSKIIWGLLGFFLSYLAVLVIYLQLDHEKEKRNTKSCPYCGEEILTIAMKCKHCGEWIETTGKD